jgi:hypothetical protein
MTRMQVVFVYGKPLSSRLAKFFTGSTCYHVGFTDGVKFYDMNLLRRRRVWPLYPDGHVILADSPAPITREYLEDRLDTDESTYGFLDYILFSMRWLYHLVGKSTRNAGGIICSEMAADDLAAHGWDVRFLEVPSPADLERAILGRINAIEARAA